MKIAHLIWGLGVGGAENMLADIANAQAEEHDVCVIVGNDDADAAIMAALGDRVKRVFLGRPPGSANPWFVVKLLGKLWSMRPDIIHVHQESFIRLRRLMPAPMLLTVHDTRQTLSLAVAGFDSVCCISEAVRDDVVARFQLANPRVVHNGVNFPAVTVKQDYGGPPPFRIVQVSRLDHEKKGQDLLIRAVQRVNDILGEGMVTVDFIGEGTSLDFLKQLAVECNIGKYCRFLGARSRQYIYANLRDYDLLVQPSRYEGFGLTVVEGIAAGLPVLVSDIEGPMEIIDGGRLGRSFHSADFIDCADKVILLAEESRHNDFATHMRTRLVVARNRFDISLTARNYLDAYDR